LPSKSDIEIRSNRHLTQSSLQVTGCTAYVLFTTRYSRRAREFPRSGQLFSTTYGCVATGRQSCPIFGFLPISPYKTPKTYLPVTSLQPRGLHPRMITIFPCGGRRSKWVPTVRSVFLRLLVGELGTPKLAQIFVYVKWLYPCRMLLHGASDLDQRCLKTRNSEDGCTCTFPSNIFAPTPKVWGTFQCKA